MMAIYFRRWQNQWLYKEIWAQYFQKKLRNCQFSAKHTQVFIQLMQQYRKNPKQGRRALGNFIDSDALNQVDPTIFRQKVLLDHDVLEIFSWRSEQKLMLKLLKKMRPHISIRNLPDTCLLYTSPSPRD